MRNGWGCIVAALALLVLFVPGADAQNRLISARRQHLGSGSGAVPSTAPRVRDAVACFRGQAEDAVDVTKSRRLADGTFRQPETAPEWAGCVCFGTTSRARSKCSLELASVAETLRLNREVY